MYRVEIPGLNEQIKKLEGLDASADKHLLRAMHESVVTLEAYATSYAPVFMGRLRNSLASEVKHLGTGTIVGRVGTSLTSEVYPLVMEYGRKPGRMPPPQALERWVQLKFGVSGAEMKRAAYNVARKIAARGIKPKLFLKKAYLTGQNQVQNYFAQALERIAEALEVKK